jgi:hypothetical protein
LLYFRKFTMNKRQNNSEVQFWLVEVCDIIGSSLATVWKFTYLWTEVHFPHKKVHISVESSLSTILKSVKKLRFKDSRKE